MSEKTHAPTPQRLEQARREGQFPRSRLLTATLSVAGALAGLCAAAPHAVQRLHAFAAVLLGVPELTASQALGRAGELALHALAAPVLGAFVGALVGGVALAGFRFEGGLAAPDLARLGPLEGLKRIVSPRALRELSKAVVLALVLAWVVWSEGREVVPHLLRLVQAPVTASYAVVGAFWKPLAQTLVAICGVLGLGDLLLDRARHLRSLRMSREELVREHRNSEGEPHARNERRAMHRQLAQGGPARGVAKASVLVVNPTHVAVALRYDERECDAPYLVAKGREADALELRRLAAVANVPIVRDVPLARTLVHLDVGEPIPEELYRAAAAVLDVALTPPAVTKEKSP